MSTPDYREILSRHYPNPPYSWVISGNNLGTLQFTGGPTPNQATLDALWPGVEAEIASETSARTKEVNFQAQYPLQEQQIIIARAQATGDKTELNTMLDFWDSL